MKTNDISLTDVRERIRSGQDRARLSRLVLEGAESPPSAPVDESWFEGLRQRARRTRSDGRPHGLTRSAHP